MGSFESRMTLKNAMGFSWIAHNAENPLWASLGSPITLRTRYGLFGIAHDAENRYGLLLDRP